MLIGSPAMARATNFATTVAARARGPCGIPKRRIVGARPNICPYDRQYISPASFVAV
jgi:hypothetical protein